MSKRTTRRQYPTSPTADDESNASEPLLGESRSTPAAKSTAVARSGGNPLPPQSAVAYNTFQAPQHARSKPKQPNRTTKISQKLKLFPDGDQTLPTPDDLDADVYTQLAQIPHGSARLEAERLSKMNKDELSRVTAYCTASYVFMLLLCVCT